MRGHDDDDDDVNTTTTLQTGSYGFEKLTQAKSSEETSIMGRPGTISNHK